MENNPIPHNAAKALTELNQFIVDFYLMNAEFTDFINSYPEMLQEDGFDIQNEVDDGFISCIEQGVRTYGIIMEYCSQNMEMTRPHKKKCRHKKKK